MTEATCTSTDPTNHQGDTCPIHEQHDPLIAALEAAEWAVPTPDSENEGACPVCFAGRPGYGVLTIIEFDRKYHMKKCQLADALEAAK